MTLCELNEAHQRLGDEVRAYAQSVIAPRADELDARGEFPRTFLREMAAKGWLGIPFPSAYGGLGLDCRSYIVALEALAQVCPSTAITIAAHCSLACFPIYAYGTEEQKRRFLPNRGAKETFSARPAPWRQDRCLRPHRTPGGQ